MMYTAPETKFQNIYWIKLSDNVSKKMKNEKFF
jgi:hypothetical protein